MGLVLAPRQTALRQNVNLDDGRWWLKNYQETCDDDKDGDIDDNVICL